MKLYTWNVNGIRSAQKKGFLHWFDKVDADMVCIQETKAYQEQLDWFLIHPKNYFSAWKSAVRPGYSGVAIYSKKEPLAIYENCGVSEFDDEGRFIRLDYPDFVLINCYFPNSQREHTRLDYKLRFCNMIQAYTEKLIKEGKNVVLCGDYNIAHQEIDLANPKSNQKNAGFLPEERQWMSQFLESGFVDVFRRFNPGPGHYTWWSNRPGVREKNIGWRIDYHCINHALLPRVLHAFHEPEVQGSDHCPVGLVLS
jgi:exodeoxyribonuclease-3